MKKKKKELMKLKYRKNKSWKRRHEEIWTKQKWERLQNDENLR